MDLSRFEVFSFFVAPVIAVVTLIAVWTYLICRMYFGAKKRREDLGRVAADLGLEFTTDGMQEFLDSLNKFPGDSRSVSDFMHGRSREMDVAVFDYRFEFGDREDKRLWIQTAIGFRFQGAPLPQFSLRPEHLGDKIKAVFGYRDISFADHPDFSTRYSLLGRDEQAVRSLFTKTVLDFYEQKPGLSTEAVENMLLVFRRNVRVEPDKIRSLMDEGFAVLKLIRRAETK